MQGIRRGKMWAKINVVIRHTVVEQKALWFTCWLCSDFPFALNSAFMVHPVWLIVQEG